MSPVYMYEDNPKLGSRAGARTCHQRRANVSDPASLVGFNLPRILYRFPGLLRNHHPSRIPSGRGAVDNLQVPPIGLPAWSNRKTAGAS